jgi:hypothetical protein
MPVETARPKFGLDFLAEVVVAASFTSWFGMMEHGQATPERTPPLGNSPAAELRTRWAKLMTVRRLSNESGRGADWETDSPSEAQHGRSRENSECRTIRRRHFGPRADHPHTVEDLFLCPKCRNAPRMH